MRMGIKQDGVWKDGERCGSGISTLVAFPLVNLPNGDLTKPEFGRWIGRWIGRWG